MAVGQGLFKRLLLILGFTSVPHCAFAVDDDALQAMSSEVTVLTSNDGGPDGDDPYAGLCDAGCMPQHDSTRNLVFCECPDGDNAAAGPFMPPTE